MTASRAIETAWTAEPFVPASRSLRTLRRAVQGCQGCPLYANTKQAVFGEGARNAALVLVGEQPGDQENKQGHSFVGPAGSKPTTAEVSGRSAGDRDVGVDPRMASVGATKVFDERHRLALADA